MHMDGAWDTFWIITKWHFLRTSNEVIWPKKFLKSMHGLKSAILSIFQISADWLYWPCPVNTVLQNLPQKRFCLFPYNICLSFKIWNHCQKYFGILIIRIQIQAVCIERISIDSISSEKPNIWISFQSCTVLSSTFKMNLCNFQILDNITFYWSIDWLKEEKTVKILLTFEGFEIA